MKNYLKLDYKQFNNINLKKILSKFNGNKTKILYISSYNPNYTRTETLLELFRENKINFKAILAGKGKYYKAIKELIKNQKDFDVIFVAFRGQELIPFIKLFAKKPIIFDAFVSIYDTLCFDRKKFKPNSFIGKSIKWYDKKLCGWSNLVLVDTKTHKEYFEKEFNANNIDYLYLGCNEKLFKPIKINQKTKTKNQKIVFWYGYANPLQGVDIIIKAAKLLENQNIIFRLIGPIKNKYSNLINQLKAKNVEFIDFVEYEKLSEEINKADICLGGHFSDINKAKRVIAGKTYQFLACNKPTILADNPANKEIFKNRGLVHFIKTNDAEALANKILEMK